MKELIELMFNKKIKSYSNTELVFEDGSKLTYGKAQQNETQIVTPPPVIVADNRQQTKYGVNWLMCARWDNVRHSDDAWLAYGDEYLASTAGTWNNESLASQFREAKDRSYSPPSSVTAPYYSARLFEGAGVEGFDWSQSAVLVQKSPGRVLLNTVKAEPKNTLNTSMKKSLLDGSNKKYPVIRLMDAWKTNKAYANSNRHDRSVPPPRDIVKNAADLCDALWICKPHDGKHWQYLMDDLKKYAQGKKIILEYSNEVWNGIFDQRYEVVGGTTTSFNNDFSLLCKNYVIELEKASKELDSQGIAHEVILAGQNANIGVLDTMLLHVKQTAPSLLQKLKSIAIAPYWGRPLTKLEIDKGQSYLIDMLQNESKMISNTGNGLKQHLDLAAKNNLQISFYEFGQHCNLEGVKWDDSTTVSKYADFVYSQAFADLNEQYHRAIQSIAGGKIRYACWFAEQSKAATHGAWGMWDPVLSRGETMRKKFINW